MSQWLKLIVLIRNQIQIIIHVNDGSLTAEFYEIYRNPPADRQF